MKTGVRQGRGGPGFDNPPPSQLLLQGLLRGGPSQLLSPRDGQLIGPGFDNPPLSELWLQGLLRGGPGFDNPYPSQLLSPRRRQFRGPGFDNPPPS